MPTTTIGARGDELRRSVVSSLAAFGDALLSGPVLRAFLYTTIIVLELALAATLKTRVLAGRRCAVEPSSVEIPAFPSFVPDDVAADLRRPMLKAARSVADPELDDDLRAAYGAHPWVKRVERVRRVYPSRVALELELRRPFALVDVEAWRLTVDAEGVVLDDRSSHAPQGLAVVHADKRTSPGVPRIGKAFKSGAVLRGLALLRELAAHRDHPFLRRFRVATVDVARPASGEIMLELAGGVRVEWGAAPGGDLAPLDPSVERKLDELLETTSRYPGLRGVETVNVMTGVPFVRVGG